MKRLLTALLIVPQLAYPQFLSKSFTLDEKNELNELTVDQTFSKDIEIPLSIKTAISGLAVSGKSVLENDNDSYIRIILKNDYGHEYLVYENYPMLSDEFVSEFNNIAIETVLLNSINPKSIRIEVHNANVEIRTINFISYSTNSKVSEVELFSIQKSQNNYIADKLNKNLKRRKVPWRAAVTSVSMKSYEEKKAMFGGKLPELYGFDYYKGGYFVLPGSHPIAEKAEANDNGANQYVSQWDWRNRHGKNWMTSVKWQLNCGSCWAFASLGTMEAYINLYYNQLINYDLSEEELISCTVEGCGGGTLVNAFNYVKNNGIVSEDCFQYAADSLDCNTKCQNPSEIVSLDSYKTKTYFPSIIVDSLKQHLFKSPVALGFWEWSHGMVVAGYKTVEIGDHMVLANILGESDIVIDSLYVGETAWLVKNSWGTDWGNDGYAYIITSLVLSHYVYPDGTIICNNYSDSDIVCEDADGDGYYFWGIGPRPDYCPSWAHSEPDGDDSDINYGPMDEYGFLEQLPCGQTIKTTTSYTGNQTLSCRLGIVNGGTLTITGTTTMSGNALIRVCEGGTLIIDGGVINDASLVLVPGCTVVLRNGGVINMASGKTFEAPVGAVVNIESGEIN